MACHGELHLGEVETTEAIRRRGFAALPRRALLLFLGPSGLELGLAAYLREAAFEVVEVDIAIGSEGHDCTREVVADSILAAVANGAYCVVFAAPPSASFAPEHTPRVRSAEHVRGLPWVPEEWRPFIARHNRRVDFTASVLLAAQAVGALWLVEGPADRADTNSPAYRREHADCGSIWRMPSMLRLRSDTAAYAVTFAQCQLGAPAQKWTTLLSSMRAAVQLAPFRRLRCVCREHAAQAYVYDLDSVSPSEKAGTYPRRMSELLADALSAAARAADGTTERDGGGGGRVSDGPELCAPIRAAIEAARRVPSAFGSIRRGLALSLAEVAALPFPPGPRELMRTRAPRPRRQRGRPLPEAAHARQEGRESFYAAPGPQRPIGHIRISELFLDGVYAELILPWFSLASAAMADIRAGRKPREVPTIVVEQRLMQPWARGIVWDTRDPLRCTPVRPSDSSTPFPGKRQVDRAALRRAAQQLQWHDGDIVDQAGGGGLEARTGCELTTVLAFHHTGLYEHVDRVDAIVLAELGEEWLSAPALSLPFVPARVLPRNVIMQDKVRVDAQGRVQHYQKPRITTDASDGGEASPNAGVPFHERTVGLTTVHELALAAAVVDTATLTDDGQHADGIRAGLFAVDLESAFRFLPLQVADLWTQVFFWDPGGVPGFLVDHRLCFGGAYAVNRFQRVSLLHTAWAQLHIAAFDAAQPPPQAAQQWTLRRRSLQQSRALPPGEEQTQPRYAKPYLDDATGVALCDEVHVPAALALIELPTAPHEPGALVASHTSRLAVHCRYFIAAARELGFAVQPPKIQLGDPIIALGFAVCVREDCVRCPKPKRDILIAQMRELAEGAAARPPRPLRCDHVGRLTGRLLNLSQVATELSPLLQVGYALSSPTLGLRRGKRKIMLVHLSAGSRTHRAWLDLLDTALDTLTDNVGVPLAPPRDFPAWNAKGTLTIVTDASGDDGFGGWAFFASAPDTLYIVSEPWPDETLLALRRGATPRATREAGPSLSMPAAEVFAAVAVAAAVMARVRPEAVIAVSDCRPAASVLGGVRSPNAQMRVIGGAGDDIPRLILGVHVVRELNLDADRMSHPILADGVVRDARNAGWRHVERIRGNSIPTATWNRLTEAAILGCDRSTE